MRVPEMLIANRQEATSLLLTPELSAPSDLAAATAQRVEQQLQEAGQRYGGS